MMLLHAMLIASKSNLFQYAINYNLKMYGMETRKRDLLTLTPAGVQTLQLHYKVQMVLPLREARCESSGCHLVMRFDKNWGAKHLYGFL